MFTNLSQRERIMLVFLVIIVILAFYYFFLYEPIMESIDNLNHEILDKELILNRNLAAVARIPQLEKRYESVQYIEKFLENRIKSVSDILKILEVQADNSGLKIMSFLPRNQENSTIINMEAEGYYEELILFLDGVKILEGQIKFHGLVINKINNESDLLKINGIYIFDHQLIGGDGL